MERRDEAHGEHRCPLAPAGRERATELAEVLAGERFAPGLLQPDAPSARDVRACRLRRSCGVLSDLREWNYGDYEGRTTAEIREERPGWNVWRDGCPGGEHMSEFGARVDRAIEELRGDSGAAILVFAHGHLLRTLAARWIGIKPTGGLASCWPPARLASSLTSARHGQSRAGTLHRCPESLTDVRTAPDKTDICHGRRWTAATSARGALGIHCVHDSEFDNDAPGRPGPGPTQELRRERGGLRCELRRRARRGVLPARPQRRRQDDDGRDSRGIPDKVEW